MNLKSGRDEIVCLLKKVVDKYELTTGHEVIKNTNRKNYEDLGKMLSDISNELPNTAETLQHDTYSIDYNPKKLEFPQRKYDITGGQIKDAYIGIVSNPRPFLVDACYIYLFGIGRKGFEANPRDAALLKESVQSENDKIWHLKQELETLQLQIKHYQQESSVLQTDAKKISAKQKNRLLAILMITLTALVFASGGWIYAIKKWQVVKEDMKILPYQPTKPEIDSLEGIWLCYTGSPQARISDANRYHMVVSNVVDVKYKNGYFTFNRYGASFNHIGYMQFEAPNLVSVHSHVKNYKDSIESPRHSLMLLNADKPYISAISASWNFDIGDRNNIIGIREYMLNKVKKDR